MTEIVLFYLLWSMGKAPIWAYIVTGASIVVKAFLIRYFVVSFKPIQLTDEEFDSINSALQQERNRDDQV